MVQKLLNLDMRGMYELFFAILDQNNDKLVCETDLFNVLKAVKDFEVQEIVFEDIKEVLDFMQKVRMQEGKNDYLKIIETQTRKRMAEAYKKKTTVDTEESHRSVQDFLCQVLHYQQKVKRHERNL